MQNFREGESEHVNILLDEVKPQISNDSYSKSLARFILKQDITADYAKLEFKHTPFLPLHTFPISNLTIRLMNSRGGPLVLDDGAPTFVLLEVTNMDITGEFTITCSSSGRKLEDLTNFRSNLPQASNLSGCEVAVVSVSFPSNLKRQNIFSAKFRAVKKDGTSITHDFSYDLFKFRGRKVDSLMQEFIRNVNATPLAPVLNIQKFKDFWARFRMPVEKGYHPEMWICEHKKTSEYEYYQIEEMSPSFRAMLGWGPQKVPKKYYMYNELGHHHEVFPPSLAHVYCDLIEPNAVGSCLAPLIMMLPLEHMTEKPSPDILYEPKHLTFHKVRDTSFSEISFRFTQPNGELHVFETEDGSVTEETTVVLLVRPRQMNKK